MHAKKYEKLQAKRVDRRKGLVRLSENGPVHFWFGIRQILAWSKNRPVNFLAWTASEFGPVNFWLYFQKTPKYGEMGLSLTPHFTIYPRSLVAGTLPRL
jgi:hypothetical protein